jgi:phi13 family phage major tail protein
MSNKGTWGLRNLHIAFKGEAQAEKIEVTAAPSTDGEIEIQVTAGTLLGADSPHSVVVPLASETHTTVSKVASAIVNVLNNDDIISPVFDARNDKGVIYLKTKVVQENDSTLEIAFTDTGTTGATMGSSAAVTAGTTGYGEVKQIPGVINFAADPEGDTAELFGDDTKQLEEETNNGYTGSIEAGFIPREIQAEMLGKTVFSNGMIVESADDEPKEFALMAQINGNEEDMRFVFWRTKASRPSKDNNTNEDSVTFDTETLNLTMFVEESARRVMGEIFENDPGYANFFDSVPSTTDV